MVFACRYCSELYEAEVAQGTSLLMVFILLSKRSYTLSFFKKKKKKKKKEAEIIQAITSTPRYLDDVKKFNNPYFEGMVGRIYPPELQLNKANASETEAPF